MKKIFKDVENEGKQLAIDLKYSEIERKNILIMNETWLLIALHRMFFTLLPAQPYLLNNFMKCQLL